MHSTKVYNFVQQRPCQLLAPQAIAQALDFRFVQRRGEDFVNSSLKQLSWGKRGKKGKILARFNNIAQANNQLGKREGRKKQLVVYRDKNKERKKLMLCRRRHMRFIKGHTSKIVFFCRAGSSLSH